MSYPGMNPKRIHPNDLNSGMAIGKPGMLNSQRRILARQFSNREGSQSFEFLNTVYPTFT